MNINAIKDLCASRTNFYNKVWRLLVVRQVCCSHSKRFRTWFASLFSGAAFQGRATFRRRVFGIAIVSAALWMPGCATTPKFDVTGVNETLKPETVVDQGMFEQGERVLWGGLILGSENFQHHTQIEVLSYPLKSSQRPDLDEKPTGRFLIRKDGYLETEDYAKMREITVVGTLTNMVKGEIGDFAYAYPVVEPDDLYLWPWRAPSQSGVHFGIGISISN